MAGNVVVLTVSQRSVQTAKDAYLSYTRKSEEARAAEALNRSRILNVSVAQPATAPLRPVFPKVPLDTFAGLILGLIFGRGRRVPRGRERPEDLFFRHYL